MQNILIDRNALLWLLMLLLSIVGCSSLIAKYDKVEYQQATSLKVDSLAKKHEGKKLSDVFLMEFVDDDSYKEIITRITYINPDKTLQDVKQLLDDTPGCQDIIATRMGSAAEKVEGWLTNVDIEKYSQV